MLHIESTAHNSQPGKALPASQIGEQKMRTAFGWLIHYRQPACLAGVLHRWTQKP
jgi:hypothetical protein